jgi:hypothetical protein
MNKLLLILLIGVFSYPVFSQQDFEGRSLDKGLIYTADSDTIEGQYIVFMKDSIEYYLEGYQTRHTIPLNDVNEVLEYNGNYGNTGIWLGAIGGAVIGVVAALGTKETETSGYIQTTTIQTWPIYLCTGLGTLLGYVIGMSIDDWNTVYSKSMSFLKNLNIKQNKLTGTSVSYRVYF